MCRGEEMEDGIHDIVGCVVLSWCCCRPFILFTLVCPFLAIRFLRFTRCRTVFGDLSARTGLTGVTTTSTTIKTNMCLTLSGERFECSCRLGRVVHTGAQKEHVCSAFRPAQRR